MVCGSRSIKELTEPIAHVFSSEINWDDTVIHGGAKGVDTLAQQWCEINNIITKIVRPVNEKDKLSYLFRNAEMIGMCDKVIIVWDEISKGTKFVKDYASARKKKTILVF